MKYVVDLVLPWQSEPDIRLDCMRLPLSWCWNEAAFVTYEREMVLTFRTSMPWQMAAETATAAASMYSVQARSMPEQILSQKWEEPRRKIQEDIPSSNVQTVSFDAINFEEKLLIDDAPRQGSVSLKAKSELRKQERKSIPTFEESRAEDAAAIHYLPSFLQPQMLPQAMDTWWAQLTFSSER